MSSNDIDLRVVERGPIEDIVLVRTVAARNQPQPVPRPATLVDLSAAGAGLCVPADIYLRRGWLVELGVESEWSRARILWCHSTIGGETAAGVEFVAAGSAVAPALMRWFERHTPLAT